MWGLMKSTKPAPMIEHPTMMSTHERHHAHEPIGSSIDKVLVSIVFRLCGFEIGQRYEKSGAEASPLAREVKSNKVNSEK